MELFIIFLCVMVAILFNTFENFKKAIIYHQKKMIDRTKKH